VDTPGKGAPVHYSLPESRIGARKIEPAPVPESVSQACHDVVWRLCELPWEPSQPQYLLLAGDAWVLLRQFMQKLEPELGAGGELDSAQDWGSKLAAFEAMRADKGLSDAQYILLWIERHGKTEFAKSEAQQHGKRRFKQANDIDAATVARFPRMVAKEPIALRATGTEGAGRGPAPQPADRCGRQSGRESAAHAQQSGRDLVPDDATGCDDEDSPPRNGTSPNSPLKKPLNKN